MSTPNDGIYPGMNNGNGSSANDGGNGNAKGQQDEGVRNGAFASQPSIVRAPQAPVDLARLQRMSGDDEEKSKINVFDYLWLLWRGKWIILTCLLIAGLGTAYYTFSLPFVYQSWLTLTVNDQAEGYVPLFGAGSYSNPARVLQKELQILNSHPILDSTAERLLAIRYLDTAGTFKDSVIPVIAAAEKALRPSLKGATPMQQHARIVSYVSGMIQKMTIAAPAKDADIIQITTTAGDPHEAALIANVYAEVYQEENKVQNRGKTRATRGYLETKLKSVQDSLNVQEMNLRNFQTATQMFDGTLDASSLSTLKRKFEEEITRSGIQIAALNKNLEEEQRRLESVEPTFATELAAATPMVIGQLTSQIAQLKFKRQLMSTENPAHASEVWYQGIRTDLNRQIDSLQERLNVFVEDYKNSKLGMLPSNNGNGGSLGALTDLKQTIFGLLMTIETAKANMDATRKGLGEVEGKLAALPDKTLALTRLGRDRGALEKIYSSLSDEFQKKVIEEESLFSNARVIEPAQPNGAPISPNRSGNITTGSILGLGIGIGIVLLIAYTDSTVHSPDELEKNGFVVLSAIPLITENALSVANRQVAAFAETFPGKPSPHLITQIDPKSPIAESYRSLRTAVQFTSVEGPARTLLVTSSIPQEGKSTTSTNLAIVIAQSGARTLLIDCDLRRPVLHSVFGIAKDPGLVNVLVGGVPLEEAIHKSSIPNLDLLPSGSIPPNPSELLGSRRMRALLEQLNERYDMVILDSPPVGTVTDSVVLSTLVDATLVIVRAHKTKMEFLEKTRESLERISTNVLGVVLNDFDVSQSYGSTYRYYRYYKYYGYYSQAEDEAGEVKKERKSKKKKAEAPSV